MEGLPKQGVAPLERGPTPFLLGRADAAWALGLAALVVATRLPFRTQMLFNWDSANFALALQHFDVTQHRPHPPGYPLFVGLAKLFYLLGIDANGSLVLVALLMSAGAVGALYLLGRLTYGRTAGIIAALLLTFSVSFWSAGEVALAYPALALFSALVAFFVYRSLVRGEDYAIPATLAYSIGAGFRPDLLLLLGPLWLVGLWRRPRRTQAICVVAAILVTLLWLVPTMLLSGGLTAYVAVLTSYFGVDVIEKYSSTQSGLVGLVRNLRDTASYLFYALYASVLPLAVGLLWWARHWRRLALAEGLLLVAWAAPILLFYTVIHIGDPGYAFSLLPALLLVTARPFAGWLDGKWLRRERGHWRAYAAAALVGLALLADATIFLARPGVLTLPGLRANDASLHLRLEHIQANYRPGSTILLSYSTYKHLQFYLPEYENRAWVDIYDSREQAYVIPAGVEWLVLVDPELQALPPPAMERIELSPTVTLGRVPVQAGQTVVARRMGALLEIR